MYSWTLVGGCPRVAQTLAQCSGWLSQAVGLIVVVLWVGAANSESAEWQSLEDGCEQASRDASVAALPVVRSSRSSQFAPSAVPPQEPAKKGTANKKEVTKQKPAPSQPKERVVDRPDAKEEPAGADEAAKPVADVDSAANEDADKEGPDALAQKFAELLEKRRAEAAAKAASTETPRDPSDKPAPKESEPVVGPESKPDSQPFTEPSQVEEPGPIPEEAASMSEEPPTISVLVLQSADELSDVPRTERIGRLILTGGSVTNRSLRALEGLTVSELSIEAVRVSDAGIQHLRSVKGVRRLRLWTPEVDDAALSHLTSLRYLEILDIEGTTIQGAGLAVLKGLPNLEMLVMGPKASDAQLASLRELSALRQLDLRACPSLTLACLESLAQLKNLKIIWLPSHIRAKGKRALSESLPACEVRS